MANESLFMKEKLCSFNGEVIKLKYIRLAINLYKLLYLLFFEKWSLRPYTILSPSSFRKILSNYVGAYCNFLTFQMDVNQVNGAGVTVFFYPIFSFFLGKFDRF